MTEWGYVLLGWSVALGVLGIYILVLLRRGQVLTRRVPPEERRWM